MMSSPAGGCLALRLGFLLSAALLLLGLQLGLLSSWEGGGAQPAAPERKSRFPPDGRRADDGAHGKAPSRRQVTYVRSGGGTRRGGSAAAAEESACCLQGARPPRSIRRKPIRWHIDLQPWASPTPSLRNEAFRFLKYISTVQISCDKSNMKDLPENPDSPANPWSICLDGKFSLIHQINSKECRLYSLGLGSDDNQFEATMANSGCEVHRFDPSIKAPHAQEGERLWYHRMSIDWRDPNPIIAAHKLRINTKKLGTVLHDFGHHKIDVLKADMESAEWKILENLILEDIVEQIGQLIFEFHVHWPGFEVSGNDSTVVRYWYSLLKELELKDFRLFHTYRDLSKPQVFLKRDDFNASSSFRLSWVNIRWKWKA